MEDYQIDVMIGQGPSARSIKLDLKPLHAGRRDDARRPAHRAAARSLRRQPAARLLPRRGAGRDRAPLGREARRADRAARRRRDRAAARAARRASPTACCAACATSPRCAPTGVITPDGRRTRRWRCSRSTQRGFDRMDRALLLTIIDKFGGGPVGVETLAAAIGEEARHDRGRLRAVPHPGGLPQPHAEGPRRHAARLRALRPRRRTHQRAAGQAVRVMRRPRQDAHDVRRRGLRARRRARRSAGRLPWFGRLPGDIVVERGPVTFYFPIVTCVVRVV